MVELEIQTGRAQFSVSGIARVNIVVTEEHTGEEGRSADRERKKCRESGVLVQGN